MNKIHEKHIIQKLSITFQSLHKYLVGSIWVEIKKLDEKLYKIHQISLWIFIKIIKKLYCSQLSFQPTGENRPTAHSMCPRGLAAQQPANGPPLRLVLGSRLGLIKPGYCRSPLAVHRDGRPSALLGRTKLAVANTPCNPSSISSPLPRISRAHNGGGGQSARPACPPTTARRSASGTRPRLAPLSSLLFLSLWFHHVRRDVWG
jgi:hypothetical protein